MAKLGSKPDTARSHSEGVPCANVRGSIPTGFGAGFILFYARKSSVELRASIPSINVNSATGYLLQQYRSVYIPGQDTNRKATALLYKLLGSAPASRVLCTRVHSLPPPKCDLERTRH